MDLLHKVKQAVSKGLAASDKETLYNIFEEVIGGKLCRTCEKDRVYAYLKLKEWISKQANPALEKKVLKPKLKKK